jgi:hypothetical protein
MATKRIGNINARITVEKYWRRRLMIKFLRISAQVCRNVAFAMIAVCCYTKLKYG